MRHRVAVEADYEYRQPGTLRVPEEPAYFFCEIPEVWATEGDKLPERLFAVGSADLRDLCAGINAWQQANQPTAPAVDIRLTSVRVTVLTVAEVEAAPWLFLPHPLRYPCRCLIVEAEDRFAVSERDDFQQRAQADISALRATLPPMPPLPADELVSRIIFGRTFWFYGDRFVTQKNENYPTSDYFQTGTNLFQFALYRLSEQQLVLRKTQVVCHDYAPEETISTEYTVSRDNGGTWDLSPDFDGTGLDGSDPVWAYNRTGIIHP